MQQLYKRSAFIRRSRKILGSAGVWKPRLVFWLGALAVGVTSVVFALLADRSQKAFASLTAGPGHWLPLLLTPAGFMLCAYLAMRHFPNSQGSGIPQAIAARHLIETEDRVKLLSLKIAFGKIALTVIGLFCGASIGREGPTVQVGAAFMLFAGRVGGLPHARGLILAGSAAGIAAAFNTPLAGIMFAIEEMSRVYEARTNGLVITGVILSGMAAFALSGSYTYFGAASVIPQSAPDWLLVLACGIGGGALGAGFSSLALNAGLRIRRFARPDLMKRMLLVAGLCGLVVAAVGVLAGQSTFGTGYEQARYAIEGHALPPLFFAEKLLASFASMISGIPGGIFAPSLAVGAGMGSTIGQLLGSNLALAAILGMAGYFSGVVQAPMTAFVIIIEMTGDHNAVVPIMAVAMLAYITSRFLSREPLYHGLSRVFIAAAVREHRARDAHASP